MTILAIETSCDETSVAIIKNNQILSNVISSQISLHQKYGGVVPELAARAHSENISYVLSSAIKDAKIDLAEVDYIAYTSTPGLVSCLHVGKVVADTIATYLKKPLIPCNHLFGHIYASLIDNQWEFPVLGLLVSGGHTQLVYLKEHLKFEILGQTLDDAVGECYDKVGRMLGLAYPGGPEIDKLAKSGQSTYQLPLPKNDKTLDFSFSGLKSAAAKVIQQEKGQLNVANFSCSLQKTIVQTLINKLTLAIEQYQPKTVVLAGGVSANSELRANFLNLKQKYPNLNFIVPKLEYCTDNAAMIGILSSYQIKAK
ncbi:tRNA (adenosine(37)-N6)-threonylcarbamoyltransferase complex transferase subunit TsaD [Spiroplasma platyhelix]|uniref:tRNA N6-adenosine threonylcarbamoyltransferase n=1 Tax=Spiroplasma platyhelix PALS-1 TaxID=1276218 RepID=A0A846U1L5_9MOLU|nr:tRNA (adenosine(37)-N6)-threonylcarbamoyltransferase complex transferase subunit TsaD [Spiroplasma platyhelix]MBE4704324.1 tRNA N6-adenosine threonylcarbamoyltransferase [Spiroplasma platyhelix PALS-1]NKE38696.1 tRNA (adenosine(37)-N6)-threonylcarbamoyltransferase complex transferase subunit TsaD [Spiroplasma platyhelix PALS-1]UJB28906.1 DNA-binding/iron metalloprotein/AP endonuclease [Spiroplasma platyhelix PALS-1]